MKPYYEDPHITLWHGVAPDLEYDAVISDPPYGMNWNTDSTRFSGGQAENNRYRGQGREDYGGVRGDAEAFDPTPWISPEWVVLFGYHHFASRLPVGTVLVWLKRSDDLLGTFLSDCELAWRKGGHGVYAFRKQFPPPSRMAELGGVARCEHPTQKPVALMEWCIAKSGAPREAVILDPFAGLGTTLVAAKNLGRKAIGIEIQERYCEIAARRFLQGVLPLEGYREGPPAKDGGAE